jgi:hypothetical protein
LLKKLISEADKNNYWKVDFEKFPRLAIGK